jgi:UMF1 family MFS transporter
MQTKKNIFLWVFYDFANSLVSVIFFLYFAQWVVIDQKIPDLAFNLTFTISALLLLITVPITGALLDQSLSRIKGLRVTTLLTSLFYSTTALFAINNSGYNALYSYCIALYFYLLTFTFYTPLLSDISSANNKGLISGLGTSANYLGQFVGLLIALPFANSSISFFHSAPRAETLLPATLAFTICAIPTIFFFYEPDRNKQNNNFKAQLAITIESTRRLFGNKNVALFLLAYFFFNDAILTTSNNFPIYLEQVWKVNDQTKSFLLLGILTSCAIGSVLSGYLADRYGHKKMLVFILVGWLFIFPSVASIQNFTVFVITTTIMGLWFGANWTVSRSVMSNISPKEQNNLAFSYFGLAERASSFVGPIAWGLIVKINTNGYQIAFTSMAIFVALGLVFLKRVKD